MTEWIDVRKEIPEECEPVLIYHHIYKDIAVAELEYDMNRIPLKWHIRDLFNHSESVFYDDVTHWMPLPAAPKYER